MATDKEVDAAFKVVHAHLVQLIQTNVPFFFQGQVSNFLESERGHWELRQGIKEGLEAAEKARA